MASMDSDSMDSLESSNGYSGFLLRPRRTVLQSLSPARLERHPFCWWYSVLFLRTDDAARRTGGILLVNLCRWMTPLWGAVSLNGALAGDAIVG